MSLFKTCANVPALPAPMKGTVCLSGMLGIPSRPTPGLYFSSFTLGFHPSLVIFSFTLCMTTRVFTCLSVITTKILLLLVYLWRPGRLSKMYSWNTETAQAETQAPMESTLWCNLMELIPTSGEQSGPTGFLLACGNLPSVPPLQLHAERSTSIPVQYLWLHWAVRLDCVPRHHVGNSSPTQQCWEVPQGEGSRPWALSGWLVVTGRLFIGQVCPSSHLSLLSPKLRWREASPDAALRSPGLHACSSACGPLPQHQGILSHRPAGATPEVHGIHSGRGELLTTSRPVCERLATLTLP